ncbi:MAG: hypothetical protein JWL61_5428 [Gemmatimonadetes bacterium]|nr:hypothetical protein [Gemmatimonadota bacterium]
MAPAKKVTYVYASTDLPLIQELIRLGIEVHGALELFGAIQLTRMRRLLAGEIGEVPSRTIASHSLCQLLRWTWAASLLVKNPDLIERCIDAVNALSSRAPCEVRRAKSLGRADMYYHQAQQMTGREREALLDCWRQQIMRS